MITETGKNTIVTEWMQTFIDNYKKKDKRNLQGTLNRFKDFLVEEKLQELRFGRLNEFIISNYRHYLSRHSRGEGAASYFARFKKMVKQAYLKKILQNNPAEDVAKPKGVARKKDILTLEEIKSVAKTPVDSAEVKRAALFCSVTGLRWIDVKSLSWSSVDLKNKQLKKEQSRVDGDSKELMLNLNDTAVQLLGKSGKSDELIFDFTYRK